MSIFLEKSQRSSKKLFFLILIIWSINELDAPFIAPRPNSISLFLLTTNSLKEVKILGLITLMLILSHSFNSEKILSVLPSSVERTAAI